jgi:hypothetical protein
MNLRMGEGPEQPWAGSVTVPLLVPLQIIVRVTNQMGAVDGDPNTHHPPHSERPAQGIPVALSVVDHPPGAHWELAPLNTPANCSQPSSDPRDAVGVTGWEIPPDSPTTYPGKVVVRFVPDTAGTYTIRVRQWQLTPEGNAQGVLQTDSQLTVEVTP